MVGVPDFDSSEEDIKKWINHISLICFSQEFQELKEELEIIYHRSDMEDYTTVAFQDALYALLNQEEDTIKQYGSKVR